MRKETELQAIDFRLRVDVNLPTGDEDWTTPQSFGEQLKEELELLSGVSEVKIHSVSMKMDRQERPGEVRYRLRVRTVNEKKPSAREIMLPIKERLEQNPLVKKVFEHSWQRLANPPKKFISVVS